MEAALSFSPPSACTPQCRDIGDLSPAVCIQKQHTGFSEDKISDPQETLYMMHI